MIKYVIDGVLILLQKPLAPVNVMEKTIKGSQVRIFNDSFDYEENQKGVGGRVLIGDMNLVNKLKELGSEKERDTINEETIELLEPYFAQEEWYNENYADKVSKANGGLFKWVQAMSEYHEKSTSSSQRRFCWLCRKVVLKSLCLIFVKRNKNSKTSKLSSLT